MLGARDPLVSVVSYTTFHANLTFHVSYSGTGQGIFLPRRVGRMSWRHSILHGSTLELTATLVWPVMRQSTYFKMTSSESRPVLSYRIQILATSIGIRGKLKQQPLVIRFKLAHGCRIELHVALLLYHHTICNGDFL